MMLPMPCPLWLAALIVFTSGAAILIIEIAGQKLLAPSFGSAFYVWTAQIGVVMCALALGYSLGGRLIDRFPTLRTAALLLLCGGIVTLSLPLYTRPLAEAISGRHFPVVDESNYDPMSRDQPEIDPIWQKLDPMFGSFAAFFLPCLLLAAVSPCLVRLIAAGDAQAGSRAGVIFTWGTIGSLAGIFVTAYWLLDAFPLPAILYGTGGVAVVLALLLLLRADRWRLTEGA